MNKSYYDKFYPESGIKSKSKLKKHRNKKQRLKNKYILRFENLDNAYFVDKRNKMHIPRNKKKDFEFIQVLFINKFMEKNLNKSWNETFHNLKEKLKYSKGTKKVSFKYLLDVLTNPLCYRKSYFDYFVINDILIKKN